MFIENTLSQRGFHEEPSMVMDLSAKFDTGNSQASVIQLISLMYQIKLSSGKKVGKTITK